MMDLYSIILSRHHEVRYIPLFSECTYVHKRRRDACHSLSEVAERFNIHTRDQPCTHIFVRLLFWTVC